MRVLITAGATEVPIDRVRAITNIFSGRTGTEIAAAFGYTSGHDVTLLTSNPFPTPFRVLAFRTFDELAALMESEITTGGYDLVIHSAAVSDYRVACVLTRGTDGNLVPLDASGKMGSHHDRLFLELERTPKLVERIKSAWGFRGRIVQFKLEVGVTDYELIVRARAALARSQGDFVVANCLEWMRERAYLIGADGSVESVLRADLPQALVRRIQPT